MQLGFEHSYFALSPHFYARVSPTPIASPRLVVFNRKLAEDLGLEPDVVEKEAAAILSGNQLPDDANADRDGLCRSSVRRFRAAAR